jgi:hypothetical protein
MFDLVTAMAAIGGMWLVVISTLTGAGLVLRRAFGLRLRRSGDVFGAFWTGWALVLALLPLWHLGFRVNWEAALLVAVLGAAGLAWNRADIAALVRRSLPRYAVWYVLVALVAVWLSNLALDAPWDYDTGLYHLPSVEWASAYPAVPGLGNLYAPLARNSSYFLFAALLDFGPWAGRYTHLVSGVILLPLIAQAMFSGFKLALKPAARRLSHLLVVAVLPMVVYLLRGSQLASLSTDLPVFVLGVVVAVRLLDLLEDRGSDLREHGYSVFIITALAAIGAAVKLSFSAFGGVAALIAVTVWWRRAGRDPGGQRVGPLAWAAGFGLLAAVAWMAHGLVLSGYIAYPSTVGSLPVDWRMLSEHVQDEARWIRADARLPGEDWETVLADWDWLDPWFRDLVRQPYPVVLPVGLLAAGGALALGTVMRRRAGQREPPHAPAAAWLVILPSLVSLAFWFFTAPNIRFAGASLWVLGASVGLLALDRIGVKRGLAAALVIGWAVALSAFSIATQGTRWQEAGPDHGFHPIPPVELREIETDSGVRLYTPVADDRCWDAPLPCSPQRLSDLRLRRDGDLRRGFTRR